VLRKHIIKNVLAEYLVGEEIFDETTLDLIVESQGGDIYILKELELQYQYKNKMKRKCKEIKKSENAKTEGRKGNAAYREGKSNSY